MQGEEDGSVGETIQQWRGPELAFNLSVKPEELRALDGP